MVSAVVLISVEHDHIPDVAQALAEMDGVTEVHSVAGRYDLVASVRVKTNEDLAELIPGRMLKLPHIKSAETLIAFRVYSKRDVESAFSLGGRGQ
ncbi:MAG TPA: Lrp/AsnC ligand binding domain-containing protein [Gemmatimonadales bacterium]|nr:Lrp/AsnC ligand binding domain-containing protein [Gemmatimonadales bacterium]